MCVHVLHVHVCIYACTITLARPVPVTELQTALPIAVQIQLVQAKTRTGQLPQKKRGLARELAAAAESSSEQRTPRVTTVSYFENIAKP